MTASLLDDLSALTGEEVFTLVGRLDAWIKDAEKAAREAHLYAANRGPLVEQVCELRSIRADVLAQIARITVPIREAQGIIWRARHVRHHPVKVPGTI